MSPGKRRAKAWVPLPVSGQVGDGEEDGVKDQGFRALNSGSWFDVGLRSHTGEMALRDVTSFWES